MLGNSAVGLVLSSGRFGVLVKLVELRARLVPQLECPLTLLQFLANLFFDFLTLPCCLLETSNTFLALFQLVPRADQRRGHRPFMAAACRVHFADAFLEA